MQFTKHQVFTVLSVAILIIVCVISFTAATAAAVTDHEDKPLLLERDGEFRLTINIPGYEGARIHVQAGKDVSDDPIIRPKVIVLDPQGIDRTTYDKDDPSYQPYAYGFVGDSIYFDWVNPKCTEDFSFDIVIPDGPSKDWKSIATYKFKVVDELEYHKYLISNEIQNVVCGQSYSGSIRGPSANDSISYALKSGSDMVNGLSITKDGRITGTPSLDCKLGRCVADVEVTHKCGAETHTMDGFVVFNVQAAAPVKTYTVTFTDVGGGPYDELTGHYAAGETISFPTITKDGYRFVGWRMVFDDNIYTKDSKYIMPAGNLRFTSFFEKIVPPFPPIQYCSVMFNGSAGLVHLDVVRGSVIKLIDPDVAVMSRMAVISAPEFAGWYNGDIRIGTVGDLYTVVADVTLSAHYEAAIIEPIVPVPPLPVDNGMSAIGIIITMILATISVVLAVINREMNSNEIQDQVE